MGHKGPVTAIRYNPHLYTPAHKPGAAPTSPDDEAAGSIITAGSTDKTFSIWAPCAGDEPLAVARGFFGGMVNDVAWSADGRVMVVAAYDGSVATALFADGELGKRVPQAEVEALLAQLYGDPALRAGAAGREGGGGMGLGGRGGHSGLAAAPELMALEARARAEVEREERLNSRLRADGAAAAAAGAGAVVGAGTSGAAGPAAAGAAGLRPPLGAATGLARAAMPPTAPAAARVPLAVTQNGVGSAGRGAGVGSNSPAKAGAGGARGGPAGTSGRDADQPPAKRIAVQPVGSAATAMGARAGAATAATTATAPPGVAAGAGAGAGGHGAGGGSAAASPVLVPVEALHAHFSFLIHAQPGSTGEGQVRVCAIRGPVKGHRVAPAQCFEKHMLRQPSVLPMMQQLRSYRNTSSSHAAMLPNLYSPVHDLHGRPLVHPVTTGGAAGTQHGAGRARTAGGRAAVPGGRSAVLGRQRAGRGGGTGRQQPTGGGGHKQRRPHGKLATDCTPCAAAWELGCLQHNASEQTCPCAPVVGAGA